jgi:sulfur-oxidizing protein SoxZ
MRARIRDGLTTLQAVLKHPMDTGNQRDPETGKFIPAFFIEYVEVHHGSRLIMSCDWSRAVSKNPYLSCIFSGAQAGDKVSIGWRDSRGDAESNEVLIT